MPIQNLGIEGAGDEDFGNGNIQLGLSQSGEGRVRIMDNTFWAFARCQACSGLPWWLRGWSVCLQCGRPGFDPWVGKIPWRRIWHPTPVFLPGDSHGQRSLAGYSPWGCKESDMTEQLHFHFRHCSKNVSCNNSLHLPNIPVRQVMLLFSFYRWEICS